MRNPIAEIPRESFCKAYREFTELSASKVTSVAVTIVHSHVMV